jgi:hypothetical protein
MAATVSAAMKHGRRTLLFLLGVLVAVGAFAGPAQAYVYWTNAGPGNDSDGTTIGRVNLDGGGAAHGFLSGLNTPGAMAVDGGHIYWANTATNSIGRANLDGTGVDPNFIPSAADPDLGGGNIPNGVATDGTYIYWTDGERYVGRATLAGGSVSKHFINAGSGSFPIGIAVASGTIYLTSFNQILRVPADGGSAPTTLVGLPGAAIGTTSLAAAGGFLYIGELKGASNSIARVQTDGGNLDESFIPNVHLPTGVASDGTYIYWVDHAANTIGRALLGTTGATNIQSSFVSEPGGPDGVAVDSLIDITHTTIACTATTLPTGNPTTCTAKVSDSASSAIPTGTVNFTGNGAAFFSGNPCTLAPAAGGGASCVVGAVPTTVGMQGLHAAYSGDATHNSSAGDITICAGTGTQCASATPPPPPPRKPECTVPRLKGKSLSAARRLLSAAHCGLGKIKRPHASKHHKLRPLVVGSQSPSPGRRLASGSKVAIALVQTPPKRTKRRR